MKERTIRLPDELAKWLTKQAGLEQAKTGEAVSEQDVITRALESEKARTEGGGR